MAINPSLKNLLSKRLEKNVYFEQEDWQELGMFGGGFYEFDEECDEDEYEDEDEEYWS